MGRRFPRKKSFSEFCDWFAVDCSLKNNCRSQKVIGLQDELKEHSSSLPHKIIAISCVVRICLGLVSAPIKSEISTCRLKFLLHNLPTEN